jgi:DHA1 family tetracycline resistance protein-like MFS transporter
MVFFTPMRIMLLLVLLDMIGVGFVIPSLPTVAREIGLSATQYGLVGTFYGAGQLFGSPLCGSMSDRLGRKRVLVMSFAGSCLFYGMIGVADSLVFLLLCRFGVGLVKQTVTMSSAYLSDVTNEQERTRAMSLNAMFMGIGFIVGPVSGSFVARIDSRLPFFLAAAVFALNLVIAHVWLPRVATVDVAPVTVPHNIKQGMVVDDCPAMRGTAIEGGVFNNLKGFVGRLTDLRQSNPLLARVFALRFAAQATAMLLESTLLMFLAMRFEVDAKMNGFFLGLMGLVGVLTNGCVIHPLVHRLGESKSLVVAFALGSVSTLAASGASSFVTFMACMTGQGVAMALSRTCLTSLFSILAPSEQRGTLMGLADSLNATSRVAIPVLGGALLDYNSSAPFFVNAVCQAALATVWYLARHSGDNAAISTDAAAGTTVVGEGDVELTNLIDRNAGESSSSVSVEAQAGALKKEL